MRRTALAAAIAALSCAPAWADPVNWADWSGGVVGIDGSASGSFVTAGGELVDIRYRGEIAFLQDGVNANVTDYFVQGNPPPYTSALVDNRPPAAEMIALSTATTKTLSFSRPVDNLFFAVVSLNGNGYQFDHDFEVVSTGCGYWGCGGLEKVDLGNGSFQANSTGGEPHGVIRFTGAVSSITWTSLTDEYWNGFTVGTYGLAPVPEPATALMAAAGLVLLGAAARRRRGEAGCLPAG
ncbi:PEP-CTERM sorting domain-containing protein [Rubrivivax gelatinosus]|nr:PEP-CTERM sorting domain-containing protein [Rubrivivax gelatinosus]